MTGRFGRSTPASTWPSPTSPRAPSLAAAVADAQARVAEVIAHIQPMPAALRHSDVQHRALIDAIERGDRAAARAIMGEHISATANLLRRFLV
jgi:DNA-binding GntR family transcriptional regulator